jgi:hypothetical protein
VKITVKRAIEYIADNHDEDDETQGLLDAARMGLTAHLFDQPLQLIDAAVKARRARIKEEALYEKMKKSPKAAPGAVEVEDEEAAEES